MNTQLITEIVILNDNIITRFPTDIALKILEEFSLCDLLELQGVSRAFYNLINGIGFVSAYKELQRRKEKIIGSNAELPTEKMELIFPEMLEPAIPISYLLAIAYSPKLIQL